MAMWCSFSAGTATAETKTWVGGSGSWETAASWSPSGVPTSSDDAVIGGSPSISTADAAVGSLNLTGTLTIGGRTLTVGSQAASTIAGPVSVGNSATLRLNGNTTWSAGNI